ncbi:hypothetical protein AKJ08_0931 [Vulgatibacter incomptus]|uniref:Uncharacterized protein n=1 Tax=Vulgatibacter incomptus TaxID=1391653 RepID=A0A0K1PBP5_9BACT|nr:hypothetical protein AKJ08_0931 [Vulgatibacter incomptus]
MLPVVCGITASLLTGCKESKAPEAPAPAASNTAEAAAKAAAEKRADASTPSAQGVSSPDCVGPIDTGVPEVVTIAGKSYERNGYKLTVKGDREAEPKRTIGVLANLNEASGENLFNVKRYLAFFKDAGAEMIVVAGYSGEDRATIETVLAAVADSGLPVLVIAGNRERTTDFTDAMNAVHKNHPNVLNGNRVRYVDLHGVDLVTLPGYHDPRYIHQEGAAGCQYFKRDVAALAKLAAEANDPVLLVAHGQPKGETEHALDVIAPDKEHIGDANLNEVIGQASIPFGIFANVKEAGGTAIADLAGKTVVAEGAASPTLYLNPGAADSIEWTMNDSSTSTGSAAVLTIQGKQASYRIFRAAKLTDAEKAQAAKLIPASAPSAQAE